MKTRIISSCFFILLVVASTPAQKLNPQLTEVSKALECLQKREMSQWKRERAEPFTGGKDVLIEFWTLWGRRVKLSFVHYATEAVAVKEMQKFVSSQKVKQIEGIGEEAYAWGYSDDIGLRKGNLTVWVSTVSLMPPVMRSGLEPAEVFEFQREDQRKMNKSFAWLLSQILSDLSAACKPQSPALYNRF